MTLDSNQTGSFEGVNQLSLGCCLGHDDGMDHTDREGGLRVARSLARNGEHASWQAVETRMHQLGFYHADVWFGDAGLRREIDALCATAQADG